LIVCLKFKATRKVKALPVPRQLLRQKKLPKVMQRKEPLLRMTEMEERARVRVSRLRLRNARWRLWEDKA